MAFKYGMFFSFFYEIRTSEVKFINLLMLKKLLS